MKLYVNDFKGFAPKIPSRNKPDNFADLVQNADLDTGDIRCWDHRAADISLPPQVKYNAISMFKWRFNNKDYWWSSSASDQVGCASIQIPDSTSGREQMYWLQNGGTLMVCEGADLLTQTGNIEGDSVIAGFTKPATPTLTVQGTATPYSTPSTYSYVVCAVREWNDGIVDVGPASDPAENTVTHQMSVTVYPGQTVLVGNIKGVNAHGNCGANAYYIYRSMSSSTGKSSYGTINRVTFPEGTSPSTVFTYTDTFGETSRTPLESLYNTELPSGAHSFLSLQNGLYCAAKDATIYVSVLNRPYAFPQDYQITLGDNIIRLGCFGNTVVALTDSEPVLITISDPANPIVKPLQDPLPIVSGTSCISTSRGVLYSSPIGVILISNDAPQNLTSKIYDLQQWTDTGPSQHSFAYFGSKLYMFNRGQTAYKTLDFNEYSYNSLYANLTNSGLVDNTDFGYFACGWWDPDTQTYYIHKQNSYTLACFKMYPQGQFYNNVTWRSKTFVSAQGAWRPAAMKINQTCRDGSTCYCNVQVVLDGKTIFNKQVTGQTPVKLPAGYTGTELYFIITINATAKPLAQIHSVTIASSMVELLEGAAK